MGTIKESIDVTICDFCHARVWSENKCIVCGKDICENHNLAKDFRYKAHELAICSDHKSLSLDKIMELAVLQLKLRP